MTIEQINEVLDDLNDWNLKNKYTKVASTESNNYYSEKSQGDLGEKVEIYKLGIEDWHLKVVTVSDSYGDDRGVSSIKFVKPIVKQITDFQ